MAINRALYSGMGMQKAIQQSNQSVNDTGGFRTYMKKTPRPMMGKIPAGTLVFDIIPFIAERDFGVIKAGTAQYVLDVWAHTNVGPTKDSVICPAATLGLPCPICEERSRLEASGAPQEAIKELKPKRRVVYNVWVHDTARVEENKGVQILEGAHFSFEKNIQAIARNPVTGEFIFFADIDTGKSVAFTRTGTGAKDTRYDGFMFVDRRAPIPDAIVAQSIALESYVEVLSYDELASKFRAVPKERLQEPDDVPAGGYGGYNAAPAAAPVYGQTAPVYGQTAPAAPAAPVYGQTAPAAPAAPVYGQTAPAAPVYGQTAPTAPVAPTAAPVAAAPAAPVQVGTSDGIQCPMADIGGIFGKSLDTFDQCSACAVWDECSVEHDSKFSN